MDRTEGQDRRSGLTDRPERQTSPPSTHLVCVGRDVHGDVEARGRGSQTQHRLTPEPLRVPVVVAVRDLPWERVQAGNARHHGRGVVPGTHGTNRLRNIGAEREAGRDGGRGRKRGRESPRDLDAFLLRRQFTNLKMISRF